MKNQVSKNLNEDFFLKNCYVCSRKPKGSETHLKNYGGVVCYCCRQFFRRSLQKTKNPKFVCKSGSGACGINDGNCRHCRYKRCIDAGMDPMRVLTTEQRLERFRRRSVQSGSSGARSRTGNRSGCDHRLNPALRGPNLARQDQSSRSGKKFGLFGQHLSDQHRSGFFSFHQNSNPSSDSRSCHPNPKPGPVERAKGFFIDQILAPISKLKGQSGVGQASASKPAGIQQDPVYRQSNETLHWHQNARLREAAAEAAKHQLCHESRRNCVHQHPMGLDLQQSSHTSIHPDVARQGPGFQPIQGRFQSQGPQVGPYSSRVQLPDPFEMMASFRKVISWLRNNDFPDHDDDDNSSIYSDYDDDDDDDGDNDGGNIKDDVIKPEMTKRKSIDTDFLLDDFAATGSSLKRRKSAVEVLPVVDEAKCCPKPSLIKTEDRIVHIIIVAPWPEKLLSPKLTYEEAHWLQTRLNLFDSVVQSVPLGSEVIKELLKLSMRIQPSGDLLPKLMQIFMERLWRLINVLDEFDDFCEDEKKFHFRKVGAVFLTLFLLRNETKVVGKLQQIQAELPEYDQAGIQDECLKLFKISGKKVKKFWWLRRQIQQGLKPQDRQLQFPQMTCLRPSQLSSYKDLVENLAPLLKNQAAFKLMIYMTVLDLSYLCDDPISRLQFNFLDLFSKRVKFSSQSRKSQSSVQNFQPRTRLELVNQVLTGLTEIKRFCHFFSNGK